MTLFQDVSGHKMLAFFNWILEDFPAIPDADLKTRCVLRRLTLKSQLHRLTCLIVITQSTGQHRHVNMSVQTAHLPGRSIMHDMISSVRRAKLFLRFLKQSSSLWRLLFWLKGATAGIDYTPNHHPTQLSPIHSNDVHCNVLVTGYFVT